MQVLPGVLAAVGSLCLTLALILAWCLVGVRTTGFMKRSARVKHFETPGMGI
jgi:hypothetical protein